MQIASICNLRLEFRKITPFGHAPPPRLADIQADFEINRPLDIKLPRNKILTQADRQTDGQTDGRTNG